MRYRLFLVLLLGSLSGLAQSKFPCNKVVQFKRMLDAQHVNPLVWDDAFAIKVVDQLFLLIDPQTRYFTQDEKNLFLINSKKLGNALADGDCSIIKEFSPIYKSALTRADRLIKLINQQPLTFDDNDTLKIKLASTIYPTNDEQLKKQWTQLIKLGVIVEFTATPEEAAKLKTNYKSALDRGCKKYLNVVKRRLEVADGFDEYLLDKLLNAIAKSYDPHTEFFSSHSKQQFLDAISSDHFSFGILLGDDAMGNIVIERIIPGSSAWDARSLHVGDVVTEVSSSHMEKIDATLYSSEELDEMLTTISKEVELTVKKTGGEQITVKLVKQKVREDDNKIKSLILFNEKNRFGYIDLPVFFSKSELTKTGCATDLAKEIIQLKKANIQGLILDLRNNGGGDLSEAIDLAGIFIDRGAISIVKHRTTEAETLKDTNLGTAYDGPLLVMINGGSASASELFAGAMRAHNRGILVGGTTYGKATGQSLMPFIGSQEMVKITSFRFYDVKGTSHQGLGVVPDIVLPDMFSIYNYGERKERNVLPADKIDKKTYYTPLAPLPIDILRDSSNRRINKSVFFSGVEERKKKMRTYIKGNEIRMPLSVNGLLKEETDEGGNQKENKPVAKEYTIRLTTFDQQVNGIDEFGAETFKTLIEKVSKDYYVEEALNILKNYKQLKK